MPAPRMYCPFCVMNANTCKGLTEGVLTTLRNKVGYAALFLAEPDFEDIGE
ncbi:MAG: hypothetical protein PHE26_11065 [Syntrophomonadaceae bacterium]|nr:hypothetical protein [Syntrophomonadaceae bacterium]